MSFGNFQGMSFDNFEFPNTNFYNSDLRELIAMYKKLVAEYDTIKAEIDEVTKKINEFTQYVDTIIDERINLKLKALTSRVNMLEVEMKQVEAELDNTNLRVAEIVKDIINLGIRIDQVKVELKADIAEVYIEFGKYKESIDDIIQIEINKLIAYIDEHVTKLDRLDVVNPITGVYEDIQNVLNDICDSLLAGFGITAEEYDKLALTAMQYDQLRITAIQYSTRGYLIFYKQLIARMRSPFTGEMDRYDNVIYRLADLHKNCLTAKEYDDLSLSAQVYDDKQITAYIYDWNSKVAIQ